MYVKTKDTYVRLQVGNYFCQDTKIRTEPTTKAVTPHFVLLISHATVRCIPFASEFEMATDRCHDARM
jgi:hypothetical protein